ncbi:MAG: hypothetical protein HXS52_02450 [Theionarchaea archaeon]|nr:hypothetical protein [Theionarchaea archaeon]MBU7036766.1 hypothetical protein [Theionarchaea archaeon]
MNKKAVFALILLITGSLQMVTSQGATFNQISSLFSSYTFMVAGDQAYCTDVMGSSKISYGLAYSGVTQNPEGRTDLILTQMEHDTGNLIIVGGPAVNPVATEFDAVFGITYNYNPGISFEIFADGYSIFLNLSNHPAEDTCIVHLGQSNGRNVMLVWGYGWWGTYAGCMLIGDPVTWQTYSGYHMLMVRWHDNNSDGLVQEAEISVEQYS